MQVPEGCQSSWAAYPFSSENEWTSLPVSGSHSRTVLSSDDVAIKSPSGENLQERIII